jgi:hypothetical protein
MAAVIASFLGLYLVQNVELLAKSRIRIVPAEPHPASSTPSMTTEILTA